MTIQTAGRVALITGASAGIGEATARVFADAGMRLALCARRADRLERLAGELRARGAEVAVFPLDVTDAAAVRGMVEPWRPASARWTCSSTTPAAGSPRHSRTPRAEEFRALLELNLIAVVTASQAVLPLMRGQGRGHILNVSSVVGRRSLPGRAAYAATKFAMVAVSESLRLELRGSGVHVSLVYPIYTVTEFHDVETRRFRLRRRGPVQSAEQVARAILRCVRRPRAEVYPYRPARLLAGFAAMFPGLLDRMMGRVLTR